MLACRFFLLACSSSEIKSSGQLESLQTSSMDLQIQDRVAIITGASTGIGLETAKVLADEGARLLLTDQPQTDWSHVQDQITDFKTIEADLTKQSDCDRVVVEATREFGACDILVHTAGITGEKGHPLEMSDQAWREAWDIDFFTAVRMCRAVVPAMRRGKWGRCVFVSSENAVQPYIEEAVYNCAKASLECFVKNLSKAEGEHNVLINSVAPAFIKTPMTDGMMEKRAEENNVGLEEAVTSFLAEERPGITAKRRGRAHEVASVIALLCSERASFVNGSNYRVDSGSVMTANY